MVTVFSFLLDSYLPLGAGYAHHTRDEWRIKCNKVFSHFLFPNILSGKEQVWRESMSLRIALV